MTEFIDEVKPSLSQDEIRLELFNQSFIQLMKTRDGRRFVWGMLEKTGFTGQTFTGQRETSDFNQGKRDTGIMLFSLVDEFCPETFSLMMREAKEDREYDHGKHTSGATNSEYDSISSHTRPASTAAKL